MDAKKVCDELILWLRQKVEEAGASGLVFGLSGGIDSSVVGVLSKKAFPDRSLGLIMPCYSNEQDKKDAIKVAEKFGIEYRIIPLEPIYDRYLEILPEEGKNLELAHANIKPRLRMITLYYFANTYGYMVVGTGNRSELEVGYFTKYGDGGVDLLPLGDFVKSEVRELARCLGVPEEIITKPPSAGLWEGQTDEKEMGLTYKELDTYLLTGEGDPRIIEKIEAMRKRSAHKRVLPEIFKR